MERESSKEWSAFFLCFSLNINNVPIKHSHCSKSLGVLIVENLTWENYIDALSKNIAPGIGAIKHQSLFASYRLA